MPALSNAFARTPPKGLALDILAITWLLAD